MVNPILDYENYYIVEDLKGNATEPWLAARLQNVQYCPLQHTRQPFPDDPYFVDGGRTSRPGPSFYDIWENQG